MSWYAAMNSGELVNLPSSEPVFEDFLEVPYIPAVRRGTSPGSLLPAEYVAAAPTPAVVGTHDEAGHSPIAVVLEKDAYGIVRTLRIQCACGSSAVITLTYDDELPTDAATS